MINNQKSKQSLTFVQLNFWEGRCYYPIINFLKREKPHIFAVQELLSGPESIAPVSMTQEDLLSQGFFNQVSEGKTVFGLARKKGSFDQRCATFCTDKATIIATHQIDLYRNPQDDSDAAKRLDEYRGLLHTVVELDNGKRVHILNHHGYLVIEGRINNPIADHNFKKIADYIATLDGAVIFSGDFNVYKESPTLSHLKAVGMKNLNDVYNIEFARNELAWKVDECVSHVFINDHIVVQDYYIAPDLVSDHQPMVLHFNITD